MTETAYAEPLSGTLAHQALFYLGAADYLEGVMRFIQTGLDAGEPVALAVPEPRGDLLRARLGALSPRVQVLDMFELGRNPARIIPDVHEMLEQHGGRLLHYVGEPIWPGRSPEEIREATRHEALINLAWPAARIRVLCPYDASVLDDEVLADAERTHPWVIHGGGDGCLSHAYTGPAVPHACEQPLPEPPAGAGALSFGLSDLGALRAVVGRHAAAAGLPGERRADLVLAANEVATNTIKHAQAVGLMRVWHRPAQVICQLEDPGRIADPLAGRHVPQISADGGLGLWMVNQLCDLVEARTTGAGNVIRLTMNLH